MVDREEVRATRHSADASSRMTQPWLPQASLGCPLRRSATALGSSTPLSSLHHLLPHTRQASAPPHLCLFVLVPKLGRASSLPIVRISGPETSLRSEHDRLGDLFCVHCQRPPPLLAQGSTRLQAFCCWDSSTSTAIAEGPSWESSTYLHQARRFSRTHRLSYIGIYAVVTTPQTHSTPQFACARPELATFLCPSALRSGHAVGACI
ncbi:hypothetical protein B0J12DRAFT_416668 [Macrophomina phaseolina]|uniref:Uncharacterized protein n=1 Tax=Macrophomina phaseolina TaxID=35725 RepID=A0ABQ8FRL6_9PEZI|nr:hypothetical protein B0J12DRAFT_416668 [Macrophomina phaseolina]